MQPGREGGSGPRAATVLSGVRGTSPVLVLQRRPGMYQACKSKHPFHACQASTNETCRIMRTHLAVADTAAVLSLLLKDAGAPPGLLSTGKI